VTVNNVLPLFVLIFWATFASAFRLSYSWWSGKRWSYGPGLSMLLLPATGLLVLMVSLKVTDVAPDTGAWVIIALHVLFVMGIASILVWRKRR
jgi:hypothetical protein